MTILNNSNNIWIEITRSDHNHGGTGWEFGTCLWVPTRNKSNQDRYNLMREPKKGDLVLHFYKNNWPDGALETRLCGKSTIASPFKIITKEPPSPGPWGNMPSYYKIELEKYEEFSKPLSLNTLLSYYKGEIRREIIESRPKSYPFTTYGDDIRTVQGTYLSKCTTNLFLLIKDAIGLENTFITPQTTSVHKEYVEGLRMSRERFFFSRNQKLVQDAKDYYGYTCQACKFNFKEKYGHLGEGYIECHHTDPLSERSESEWSKELTTTVEQVLVLCANCHRMIHRRKPADRKSVV